jgi:hypothetical protein
MKKCLIILTGILISSITLKASIKLIEIPIRGTNVVFSAPNFVQELNTYIISYDIPIEEIEDLLISYINQKPNNITESSYNPITVLAQLPKISQSNKVEQHLDTIIKSEKKDLYSSAINAFFQIYPYEPKTLTKIEEYIKLNDETSYIRRSEFYNKFSYAIDRNETLSVDVKFEMIKLMLKYLSSDLYNWRFLDQELCEKIPSYRHSIQRKNMIEYIQSNETSLNEWQKGELTKILDAFNSAIKEKSLINLTDEIIKEEINAYVPVPPKQGIGIWEP